MASNATADTPIDEDPTFLLTWLVIFVVTSFLIFASNLATILTFVINSQLRRHSVYCLLNLALADAFHGLTSVIWFIWYIDWLGLDFLRSKLYDDGIKVAIGLIHTSTLALSLFSLLLVSLDRVMAAFYPFKYRSFSYKTYLRVFVFTWFLSFVFAFIPALTTEWDIYGHDVWFFELDFLCMLCLIIIICSYTAIFINVRRRSRNHGQEVVNLERLKKEKHLALTLFIATSLSLLTWLPFIINHEIEKSGLAPPGPLFHKLTEFIQLTNSLVNPIVYVLRMKLFRQALFHMLLKCSRFNSRVHPTTVADTTMNTQVEMQPATIHTVSEKNLPRLASIVQ